MKDKETNKNKENYFFKIKKHQDNTGIMLRRDFEYSDLKNYDIMIQKIRNAILDIRKGKPFEGRFPIIIMNHPKIEEIYIYSKENWDLYFKFNLIEECITNKTLKMEYFLLNEKNKDSLIKSKKEIKYIIQNLPLNIYFDILIKFFENRDSIMKEFIIYLIAELTKDDGGIVKNIIKENKIQDFIEEEQKDKNIEENININEIICNDKKDEKNNEKNIKKEKKVHINKDYLISKKEFISILKEQKKNYSNYENSFLKIKNIFEEDEEKNKGLENKNIMQTNLILGSENSFDHLLKDEVDANNKTILMSALNPPKKYIENLMNSENFFKTFNKGEYYVGIEDYQDNLNRESLEILNSKI